MTKNNSPLIFRLKLKIRLAQTLLNVTGRQPNILRNFYFNPTRKSDGFYDKFSIDRKNPKSLKPSL